MSLCPPAPTRTYIYTHSYITYYLFSLFFIFTLNRENRDTQDTIGLNPLVLLILSRIHFLCPWQILWTHWTRAPGKLLGHRDTPSRNRHLEKPPRCLTPGGLFQVCGSISYKGSLRTVVLTKS